MSPTKEMQLTSSLFSNKLITILATQRTETATVSSKTTVSVQSGGGGGGVCVCEGEGVGCVGGQEGGVGAIMNVYWYQFFPVNTQRRNNVAPTSRRCHDVATTS